MAQTWLGISSFTYPFLSGVNPAQRPALCMFSMHHFVIFVK